MVVDRSFTTLTANNSASHIDDEESTTSFSSGEKDFYSQKSLVETMTTASTNKLSVMEKHDDQAPHNPLRQLSHSIRTCLLERADSDMSLSLRFAID